MLAIRQISELPTADLFIERRVRHILHDDLLRTPGAPKFNELLARSVAPRGIKTPEPNRDAKFLKTG